MTAAVPAELYTAAAVRALDAAAIAGGLPGAVLMKRAGRALFESLLRRWPVPGPIEVFCGTGNNGGDGFVLAGLARARGLEVRVRQVGDPARIRGDALAARAFALAAGVEILPFDGGVPEAGVVVDALLGTGLGGAVRGPFIEAVAAINAAGLPVLAADIPSGLCADSGRELGPTVRATATVCFIGLKRGLFTGAGPECAGAVAFDDLGVPAGVYAGVSPSARRLDLDRLAPALLPPRPRGAHKGHFGHVLVIGGDHGTAGAALMACEAALRTGAGLVSCATRPEHLPALVARRPEVMAHGVRGAGELAPLLERASVLVVGPGLGQGAWGMQLLDRALASGRPAVVDADALNLIASGAVQQGPPAERVFTPHPGEAARLLGTDSAGVQADRFAAAAALAQRLGGAVVLKGAGTLVASGAGIGVAAGYGNPGMASGGMGDVLSGVLGALLAQGLAAGPAAELGVCLHGRAADLAAAEGERGLVATDLLAPLRRLANP